MSRVAILIAGSLMAVSAHAAVQSLPFTDHFTYGDGNLFTVASGIWDAGGSSGPEFVVTNGAALTSPSGFAAASGKGVKWQPSGTARRNLVQFTSTSNGTLYASFLLNVQSVSSAKLIAYFDDSTSSTASPQLGIFINTGTIGIGKNASTAGATASLGSGTHLIVVRYTFQAGNDQADLWVDPSSATFGTTNAPAASGSTTGSGDPSALQYFAINAASGSGPLAYIDEVRIGTTWADVTPSDGGPPPPPPVNLSITQAFLSPGGIVLRGVGGSPTGSYEVVSATNLTNWVSIATHQFDLAGNFDCTNPVSLLDPQRFYRIHVGNLNIAPVITNQPQSQTIIDGQTANFSVGASGTPPLFSQWFFNTNSVLANATNSTLSATNAGVYSVIVSNMAGTAASDFVSLTVVPPPTNFPTIELVGFATVNGTMTGGAGGPTNFVNNVADFTNAIAQSGPRVVLVVGTLILGQDYVDVSSDKTIIGLGTNTTLDGNLRLNGVTNVILQNLTFTNPTDKGDGDGISTWYSHHIWVDHCTFVECDDGELDMTHASDFITVSWTKFYYFVNNGHNFVNLIGHDDNNAAEDTGKLHVTFHHCWWSDLCVGRMPRVRFGQVHVFNNYYNCPGNDYCVRAAINSTLLIENNLFENVHRPWEKADTGSLIEATGNVQINTDGTIDPGTDDVFTPPYSYTLETATNINSTITNNAGAGKGPFAP